MLDDFMVRAAIAGVGVAAMAGPLGCFVVWRRMAYFGDATAHAALLGVALGLALDLPVMLGVLCVAGAMAVATTVASLRGRYAMDTVLGVFAHAALAFGLVAIAFQKGIRLDLMGYLFGDILAVGRGDLALIWGAALLTVGALVLAWRRLLTSTISPELAAAEGGSPTLDRLLLSMALAVMVAVAMKIVGVLLITALLIIPAAAARPLSRRPGQMAAGAAALGGLAAVGGLEASLHLDTPSGPTIAATTFLLFLTTNALAGVIGRLRREASP